MANFTRRENWIFSRLLATHQNDEYDEEERNVLQKFYLKMSRCLYNKFRTFTNSEHLPLAEELEVWLGIPEMRLESIHDGVWAALQQFEESLDYEGKLCTISMDQASTQNTEAAHRGINCFYLLGLTMPWKFFIGMIATETPVNAVIVYQQVQQIYLKLRELQFRPRVLCVDGASPHCKLLDDQPCSLHTTCCLVKEPGYEENPSYYHHLLVVFDPHHMAHHIVDHFLQDHFNICEDAVDLINRCNFQVTMAEPNTIEFIKSNPLRTFLNFFGQENIRNTDERLQFENNISEEERRKVVEFMQKMNAVATPMLTSVIDDMGRLERNALIDDLMVTMDEIQKKDHTPGTFIHLRNSHLLSGYMKNVKALNSFRDYRAIKYTLINQETIELFIKKMYNICSGAGAADVVSNIEDFAKHIIACANVFGMDVGVNVDKYMPCRNCFNP